MLNAQRGGAVVLILLLALPTGGCVLSKLHEEGRSPYSTRSTTLEDVGATVEYAGLVVGCAAVLVGVLLWLGQPEEPSQACLANPASPECWDD